ncbi:Glypican, partial [Trichostrongylus colubriformis]
MSCEMLKKSHYDYSTLLKKGAATGLKICTGKNACCTKSIEDEILESAEKLFKAQLEDKQLVLRQLINSNLNSFRTFFYNSLNACHEHLDALFDHTYGSFYKSNSQIFDTFFNRLRAFSSPFSDAKVSQITDRLFEEMFVIMFQLMNPMHTVSASQRRCMIEGMEEIAPFGDVPKKITVHMEKSLTFWKHFVTGLDKIHNIFDGFMNVSVSKECRINLAKMWDCSLCSGEPQSKPCPGLCSNVMKGCLADWAEVDQQWNAVIDAMLKLTARLRGPQNLHQALQPLPVQLSEAVMEMQERSVTVSNKVIARCYTLEDLIREPRHLASFSRFEARHRRDVAMRGITERAENYGKVLNSLMNAFSERLSGLRGWFTELPKAFCSDAGLVAPEGEICWNGSASASYTKKIAGDGLASQG